MNIYNNQEGKMLFECDNQGCEEQSLFYGSFRECVAEAKQEGWRSYQVQEEWCHECPFCVEKGKSKDPREIFG